MAEEIVDVGDKHYRIQRDENRRIIAMECLNPDVPDPRDAESVCLLLELLLGPWIDVPERAIA